MEELNQKEIQQLLLERVMEMTQKTIASEEKFFAFPCGGGWL